MKKYGINSINGQPSDADGDINALEALGAVVPAGQTLTSNGTAVVGKQLIPTTAIAGQYVKVASPSIDGKLDSGALFETATEVQSTKKIKAKDKTILLGDTCSIGASGGDPVVGTTITGTSKMSYIPKKLVDPITGTAGGFTTGRVVQAFGTTVLQSGFAVLSDSVGAMVGTNTVVGKCRFFYTIGGVDRTVSSLTTRFSSAQLGVRIVIRLTSDVGQVIFQSHTDYEQQINIGQDVVAYVGSPATETTYDFTDANLLLKAGTTYHITIESSQGNVVLLGDMVSGAFIPYLKDNAANITDEPVIAKGVYNVSADTILGINDWHSLVNMDAVGGNKTVTLPSGLGTLANGMQIEIVKKDTSANTVQILPFSGQTINGFTSITLNSQFDRLIVVSNGTSDIKVLVQDKQPLVTQFTTSGTWTPKLGMKYAIAEVQAGGGGGGAVNAPGSGVWVAAGGSGGMYLKAMITGQQAGTSQTITIGAGGALLGAEGTGNTGGNSSVGSLVIALGGLGGGFATNASIATANGGLLPAGGGTISGCTLIERSYGQPAGVSWSSGATGILIANKGGSSKFGLGGENNSAPGPNSTAVSSVAKDAAHYGAGGGSTSGYGNSSLRTGSAGSLGIVIITEYF